MSFSQLHHIITIMNTARIWPLKLTLTGTKHKWNSPTEKVLNMSILGQKVQWKPQYYATLVMNIQLFTSHGAYPVADAVLGLTTPNNVWVHLGNKNIIKMLLRTRKIQRKISELYFVMISFLCMCSLWCFLQRKLL